jgi:hypothetical protein
VGYPSISGIYNFANLVKEITNHKLVPPKQTLRDSAFNFGKLYGKVFVEDTKYLARQVKFASQQCIFPHRTFDKTVFGRKIKYQWCKTHHTG